MLLEVLLGALLLFALWHILKKPAGLPPGRWGLPLVGSLPLSSKPTDECLADLRKQYGDIFLWRIGTRKVVFIHDYKVVRDAFTSTDFTDRPDWTIFNLNETPVLGVLGSNGLRWHNNRRFALRQMRDLGMGKSKLVTAVHTQASMLVEEMKQQAGKPARVPHSLEVAVVNIIWQMVGGIQFKKTDPKFKEFQDLVEKVTDSMMRLVIFDAFPWLGNILPASLVSRFCRLDLIDLAKDLFFAYFKEVVDKHRATLDRDNPRDLIDGYLIEMEKENPESTCGERDLYFLIFDLFNAGTQTTSATLTWLIFYMANYPQVQEKLQAEIDQVLPRGTLATLEDRARMPYTEAVIHEVLRKSSLGSLIGVHKATRDTQLSGYFIPKDTAVVAVVSQIHHDPRYWDRPDEFLPERWLDKDGKFTTKKEGFLPFIVGKRQCVGEALARMEVFIFSTALFQSFSVAPPPGEKLDLRPQPHVPFIHVPKDKQEVVVTVRP